MILDFLRLIRHQAVGRLLVSQGEVFSPVQGGGGGNLSSCHHATLIHIRARQVVAPQEDTDDKKHDRLRQGGICLGK